MKAGELKIGDRIKIIGVPGDGVPGYVILQETVRVYKKLVVRNRPVRIREIDEFGAPWYICRFKKRDGTWEEHWLAVFATDNNWILVKRRKPRKRVSN
jgi:hypothetical protein